MRTGTPQDVDVINAVVYYPNDVINITTTAVILYSFSAFNEMCSKQVKMKGPTETSAADIHAHTA